jgi:hypothetical protein
LREWVNRVANKLVARGLDPVPTLRVGVPAAAALSFEQFRAALDLALSLARRGMDPAQLLESGIPAAAKVLNDPQFRASLDLAVRLAEEGIDPYFTTVFALATKTTLTRADFQSNLESFEFFLVNEKRHREYSYVEAFSAVAAALTPAQLRAAANVAICLSERGRDARAMLRTLPEAAVALNGPQLLAGLDFALHVAENEMEVGNMLRDHLPPVANALSWEQFLAALDLLLRLAIKKVHPEATLQYGLPALAKASCASGEFELNLRSLEQFVLSAVGRAQQKFPAALQNLSCDGLNGDQFRRGLQVATRLAQRGIDPNSTLTHAVPAAARACSTAQEFAANLQAVEEFVIGFNDSQKSSRPDGAQGPRRPNVTSNRQVHRPYEDVLQCLPRDCLTAFQFQAGLGLAMRLASTNIEPHAVLQNGLPAAAKACSIIPEFEGNIQALEQFVTRHPTAEHGLAALSGATSAEEFREYLQIFDTLISKIEQRPSPSPPATVELLHQAIALRRHYEDCDLVLHSALTRQAESSDYYGGSSTYTVTDRAAWWELRPLGRRDVPIALESAGSDHLQTLLEERSWIWRFTANRAGRQRALERSLQIGSYLPVVVDLLVDSGFLDATSRLLSAYLIGSFPWVDNPSDVDLFLVVEGDRDITYLMSDALTKLGLQFPGMRIGFAVEIVGLEKMLQAIRAAPVLHARRLALRYALLHGSVLLGGRDLVGSIPVPEKGFADLHQDLLNDLARSEWSELRGDEAKILAKQKWRRCEVHALARFVREQSTTTARIRDFLSKLFARLTRLIR